MEKNNEVIQTHPLVGWDISTVDSYDALMLVLNAGALLLHMCWLTLVPH